MSQELREERDMLTTWSLVVLVAIAIGAALYFTRGVMIPFVLAAFIASIVAPIVDFQVVRLRWPHAIAVGVAVLIVLAIVLGFAFIMIRAIQTIVSVVGEYSADVIRMLKLGSDKLGELGVTDTEKILRELEAVIPSAARRAFGTVTQLITNGFLIFIFAVFLLAGRNPFRVQAGVYAEIDAKVRKYLSIKVMVSAVTGVIVGFLLYVIGLKTTAFLFGVLAFLLNFIPSIGSIVATLLPIPIAIAQFESVFAVVGAVALPGSVQLLVGNVIEPKLQGVGLRLHPVVILLSLALWGLLWGVLGMVLAVPMTAILRIVLLQFSTTRPMGKLLAGELPKLDYRPEDD